MSKNREDPFDWFYMADRFWADYEDGVVHVLPGNLWCERHRGELTERNQMRLAGLMMRKIREEFPTAIIVCWLQERTK